MDTLLTPEITGPSFAYVISAGTTLCSLLGALIVFFGSAHRASGRRPVWFWPSLVVMWAYPLYALWLAGRISPMIAFGLITVCAFRKPTGRFINQAMRATCVLVPVVFCAMIIQTEFAHKDAYVNRTQLLLNTRDQAVQILADATAPSEPPVWIDLAEMKQHARVWKYGTLGLGEFWWSMKNMNAGITLRPLDGVDTIAVLEFPHGEGVLSVSCQYKNGEVVKMSNVLSADVVYDGHSDLCPMPFR